MLCFRYRLAVIKALPQLEKLDDKIVTPEEVETAKIRGRLLIHPLEMLQRKSSPIQSNRSSPEVSTLNVYYFKTFHCFSVHIFFFFLI